GSVIDEDLGFRKFGSRVRQLWKIGLSKKPTSRFGQVDPGSRAKHALNKLLSTHLQAENLHGKLQLDSRVLGNVHCQRRFPHARPRCDHDHFRRMQTTCQFVKDAKPGRAPFICSLFLKSFSIDSRVLITCSFIESNCPLKRSSPTAKMRCSTSSRRLFTSSCSS